MPLEIYALSPEKMELREYEVPKVGKGQMKVQSLYAAAKHGTELSGIKGDSAKRGPYDPELQVFPNTGQRAVVPDGQYVCRHGNRRGRGWIRRRRRSAELRAISRNPCHLDNAVLESPRRVFVEIRGLFGPGGFCHVCDQRWTGQSRRRRSRIWDGCHRTDGRTKSPNYPGHIRSSRSIHWKTAKKWRKSAVPT